MHIPDDENKVVVILIYLMMGVRLRSVNIQLPSIPQQRNESVRIGLVL